MRRAISSLLWVYFGWYATSLLAEYAPIPGFAGAVLAIGALSVIEWRRIRLSARAALPVRAGPSRA